MNSDDKLTAEVYADAVLNYWFSDYHSGVMHRLMDEAGLTQLEALLFLNFQATSRMAFHMERVKDGIGRAMDFQDRAEAVMDRLEAEMDDEDDEWKT